MPRSGARQLPPRPSTAHVRDLGTEIEDLQRYIVHTTLRDRVLPGLTRMLEHGDFDAVTPEALVVLGHELIELKTMRRLHHAAQISSERRSPKAPETNHT